MNSATGAARTPPERSALRGGARPPALPEPKPMNWHQTYRCAPGFRFRKEAFGGILFHYEGRAPDPRLTFVDSAFLMDLLEQVERATLEEMIAEAREAFALDAAQEAALRGFFRSLVERQALVPKCAVPK